MQRRTALSGLISAGLLVVLTSTAPAPLNGVLAAQVGLADGLAQTLQQYREGGMREAEAGCDRIIAALQGSTALDDLQRHQLLTALELRARARFAQGKLDGARSDFRDLLTRDPRHVYGSLTVTATVPVNQNSVTLFETVRTEVVGSILLTVSPDDAEVRLNDTVVPRESRSGSVPIILVSGSHRISAQRPGHRSSEVEVVVPAGGTLPVTIALERVLSKVDIITVPAGVEVFVGSVSKGRTKPGALPPDYVNLAEVAALGPARDTAGMLELLDVETNTLDLEYRLDCYRTETGRFPIEKAGDYHVIKRMTKAAAQLSVTGAGGMVFIDGERMGPVPYSRELCQQAEPYVVEVRSERGRQITRVSAVTGDSTTIKASPKPAVAILSQVGLPDTFRDDLRRELESALQPADDVTFFAVPRDQVRRELGTENLEPGWLSFDVRGQPLSPVARGIRPDTRAKLSASLAQRLDVQGIAEIHATAGPLEPRSLNVTFLAAGSGVPETFFIRLDEPTSVRRALATLNEKFAISAVSTGIKVIDVEGAGGAVVLQQVWDLTNGSPLAQGDVIVAADGRKIEDALALESLAQTKKPGDVIQLQVRGRDGAVRNVALRPASFASVVGYFDATLPINRLLLGFRLAVMDAVTSQERSWARLNLAVALMRAGNWVRAREELERVDLPDLKSGQGISRGTVQYYLGLCLDALGRPAEADKAFQAAAASPGALLTTDGQLVQQLAQEKLKDPRRRR